MTNFLVFPYFSRVVGAKKTVPNAIGFFLSWSFDTSSDSSSFLFVIFSLSSPLFI